MLTTRTAALAAILLLPLVTSAPADHRRLHAAQAVPTYTYQGTVHAVNSKAGSLELITGVGMALRLVRMSMAPAARPALAQVKPGDVVRAECRRTEAGLVADRVEKLKVASP